MPAERVVPWVRSVRSHLGVRSVRDSPWDRVALSVRQVRADRADRRTSWSRGATVPDCDKCDGMCRRFGPCRSNPRCVGRRHRVRADGPLKSGDRQRPGRTRRPGVRLRRPRARLGPMDRWHLVAQRALVGQPDQWAPQALSYPSARRAFAHPTPRTLRGEPMHVCLAQPLPARGAGARGLGWLAPGNGQLSVRTPVVAL